MIYVLTIRTYSKLIFNHIYHMDARGLKEKYQTVLALFVYSGILIPLLAIISGAAA